MCAKTNKSVNKAKFNKQDECYTLYRDVEECLRDFVTYLKGKVVYCPCDVVGGAYPSHIAWYFAHHFDALQLKGLYCSTKGALKPLSLEPVRYDSLRKWDNEKKYWRTKDLKDGSYDSKELQDVWKKANVIVTNPPFSIWGKFYSFVKSKKKKFLLVADLNKLHLVDVYSDFCNGLLWIANTDIHEFAVPDGTYIKIHCAWLTNINIKRVIKPYKLNGTMEGITPCKNAPQIYNVDDMKSLGYNTKEIFAVPVSWRTFRLLGSQFLFFGEVESMNDADFSALGLTTEGDTKHLTRQDGNYCYTRLLVKINPDFPRVISERDVSLPVKSCGKSILN